MPNSLLSLNYEQCHPGDCGEKGCLAAEACPLNILRQEDRNSYPFAGLSPCKGCGKCLNACPLKAIKLA